MWFLANENFPLDAVEALRSAGYDVAWVRTDAPGSSDRQVLDRAVAERRTLLTYDKDFGELAFRSGLPADCGVVLFRLPAASSADLATRALIVLQSRGDWAGHFAVIEPARIRIRPLPGGATPPDEQEADDGGGQP